MNPIEVGEHGGLREGAGRPRNIPITFHGIRIADLETVAGIVLPKPIDTTKPDRNKVELTEGTDASGSLRAMPGGEGFVRTGSGRRRFWAPVIDDADRWDLDALLAEAQPHRREQALKKLEGGWDQEDVVRMLVSERPTNPTRFDKYK